jgi:glycyl-tRNA synthetase beta chain
VVGLTDRLDTLVCIFGLGMVPSGSSDPFALRRAANAIVNITWAANLSLDLGRILDQVVTDFASHYAKVMKVSAADLLKQLQDFLLQRVQTLLREDHQIDYDLVNAVIGDQDAEYADRTLSNLLDARDRAHFLQTIRTDGRMAAIYETVNRASRLAAQGNLVTTQLDATAVVQPALFQKSSEQGLYDALAKLPAHSNYDALVAALSQIAPTVSQFFDGEDSVLVMDPDPEIKQNRLNLLGILRNHARLLADFGAIVKG